MTEKAAAIWVDINDLKPWNQNPRKNDHAVPDVAKSIERFGFASPIIANADGQVIAGHTRLKAAKYLGLNQVPVRYMDLDDVDSRLLALADNKVSEIADWDDGSLTQIFRELDAEGADLEGLGWGDDEIEAMISDVIEENAVPDVEFSEFIDEANNYIVLTFKSDMDWLSAQTHFNLESKYSKRQNGKPWSKGIGRVIDGAKYIDSLAENQ
jgi:ParB family chromosome partitioning protein